MPEGEINPIIILLRLTALPVILLLVAYNLRRLLFTFSAALPLKASYHPEGQINSSGSLPDVLVLAPCRDEEGMIPGLCQALGQLDYPPEKISIVLIDDGSLDNTRSVMEKCSKDKCGWYVFPIQQNMGKAGALNSALAQIPFGEIIFIYDADHRPAPDSLKRAVKYFQDEQVAGVSGRMLPSNPLASPSAYYSTVESQLHQMVTMRAKDRLGLAPALMGSNCGYRRTCLAACGGFRQGALLEDSDLTLALYRAGYLIRFAEEAVSYHQVPQTVDGYLKQHIRWGRGFNDVSRYHGTATLQATRIPFKLRLELLMFSTGYLDRIALALAVIFSILSFLDKSLLLFPIGVLVFALVTPFIQIVVLFIEQHAPAAMWWRLPWVPVFFLLDIYAAIRSIGDSLFNHPQVWTKTERT